MKNLEPVPYRDVLDIVFANRNRAYGAYQLRRAYPGYLARALGYGLLLIGFFVVLPRIWSAVSNQIAALTPVEVDVILSAPPPAEVPPPPPPVVPPTPPPPTRSTITFVPPVLLPDDEVPVEEPPQIEALQESKADIGATTVAGDDERPPAIEENPQGLEVVEEVKPAPVEDKVYESFSIQKEPSFPGGVPELMKYLAANIKYPPLARENNIQGKVALTFVVNKNGSISDVSILKDIGGGCGKEAVRVIGTMPNWSPGEANGHPVKVRFTLPVSFKLE